MNLLMAIGQNHQLTQLMTQLQKMQELHRTEMLTAYNSINLPGLYLAINYGNADIVETIFNSLSRAEDMKGYSRKKISCIFWRQKIKMVFLDYF